MIDDRVPATDARHGTSVGRLASGPRTTVLLLPGMTLNETIFPALPLPSIAVDFTTLALGRNGVTADLRARKIAVYVDLLDRRLTDQPMWEAPRRIVVAHSFGGMLALAWWLAHRGDGPAK